MRDTTYPAVELDDLVRITRVREDFATGEAQRRHERLRTNDWTLSRAIGAGGNLVGRWSRRERTPSGQYAIRYSRIIETLERAVR